MVRLPSQPPPAQVQPLQPGHWRRDELRTLRLCEWCRGGCGGGAGRDRTHVRFISSVVISLYFCSVPGCVVTGTWESNSTTGLLVFLLTGTSVLDLTTVSSKSGVEAQASSFSFSVLSREPSSRYTSDLTTSVSVISANIWRGRRRKTVNRLISKLRMKLRLRLRQWQRNQLKQRQLWNRPGPAKLQLRNYLQLTQNQFQQQTQNWA